MGVEEGVAVCVFAVAELDAAGKIPFPHPELGARPKVIAPIASTGKQRASRDATPRPHECVTLPGRGRGLILMRCFEKQSQHPLLTVYHRQGLSDRLLRPGCRVYFIERQSIQHYR